MNIDDIHLHLQWFAEDDSQTSGEEANTNIADSDKNKSNESDKVQPTGPDQGKTEQTGTVTKAEYDKLMQAHKEIRTKLEKRQKDEEKAKEKALAEQGRFKELHETASKELDSIKPKVERYEAVIKSKLDDELRALPANFDKTLIPDGDIDKQLDWILKAKNSGLLKTKATGDQTPPASGEAEKGWGDYVYTKK